MQSADSGIAALLFATMPMWLVLMQWLPAGKRPEPLTLAGVAVGFLGVAVLILPSLTGGTTSDGCAAPWAYLALVAGAMFWAIGSLRSRRRPPHQDVRLSVALQLLCGGVLLGLVGAARGEIGYIRPAAMGDESLTALGYLIVIGSLTGFWAYAWLLRVAQPTVVGTYAFINPIVAVVIGRSLLWVPPITTLTKYLGATLRCHSLLKRRRRVAPLASQGKAGARAGEVAW